MFVVTVSEENARVVYRFIQARNALRDKPGIAVKFTTPVVAAGTLYVGISGQLAVFGPYTIRVEVTNVQTSGGKWSTTVNTVDASTGQPVAGAVTINRTSSPTPNQQMCFPPCSTHKTESVPTGREPPACTGIVTIPGFPPKHIRVGLP